MADDLDMLEALQAEEKAVLKGPRGGSAAAKGRLEAAYDIPVQVSTVLGHASIQVNRLLRLGRGAVVELDRKIGESVDIYVNNQLVARGELVVVDDRLAITLTEIIRSRQSTD